MKKAIVTQLRLYQKKKIYECSGSGSSDVVAAVNDRILVLVINNARSRKPCTNNAYPKAQYLVTFFLGLFDQHPRQGLLKSAIFARKWYQFDSYPQTKSAMWSLERLRCAYRQDIKNLAQICWVKTTPAQFSGKEHLIEFLGNAVTISPEHEDLGNIIARVEVPDSSPDFRDKIVACPDFPDQNLAFPDFCDHDDPPRLSRPKLISPWHLKITAKHSEANRVLYVIIQNTAYNLTRQTFSSKLMQVLCSSWGRMAVTSKSWSNSRTKQNMAMYH